MADWAIEPLADHHDRAGFVCGKPPLDDWLRRYVGQYQRRDLTRAYVLVRPGQPRVHGYYAISNRHIDFAHLPPGRIKKLPRSLPLPAVLIGQLAEVSPGGNQRRTATDSPRIAGSGVTR